jgi:GT2 family glycosyltransferase
LIRVEGLKIWGAMNPSFENLAFAGVEMGLRWLSNGAVVRISRYLAPLSMGSSNIESRSAFRDEVRFIASIFGERAAMTVSALRWWRFLSARRTLRDARKGVQPIPRQGRYQSDSTHLDIRNPPSVSVVLPTLKRYDYLEKCLASISSQTACPIEIICIDQNAEHDRNPSIYDEVRKHIPTNVIWLEERGQSHARNAGLASAEGKYVFFADDDSEYLPDTIQNHLKLILTTEAAASTGISLPFHPYVLPDEFSFERASYLLDTGNCLVSREAALDAGGFDRAYDFGKGADSDFGLRLHLRGKLIMHNPNAIRYHHKAETGGLRVSNSWWSTTWTSLARAWPIPTTTYFLRRFFPGEMMAFLSRGAIQVIRELGTRGLAGKALVPFLPLVMPYQIWLSFHFSGRLKARYLEVSKGGS